MHIFHFRHHWAGLCVMIFLAATVGHGANPVLVELNVGETRTVALADKPHTIKLQSLSERTEPFLQRDGTFVEAVVAADLALEVDGAALSFTGGPFRLPVELGDVAVLLGCSKGWAGGTYPDRLAKDVRLELKPAGEPWPEPGRFIYPIRNYRWRASNYQHTYLGIVVNQARVYYHRGEDQGMIPDLDQVLAMTDGEVIKAPPPGPKGDQGSNVVVVADPTGLETRYVHMNALNILPWVKAGAGVRQGRQIGLTGNTFDNHRSPSPHLHVSMNDASKNYFNTFPIIVAAYRKSFPGELLPIAGNVRHMFAGEEITLDGSMSLAGEGAMITNHEWTFCDGGKAATAQVKRRYPEPGVYSEQLRVTDNRGRTDLDFVEVNVFSRGQKIQNPRAWINYYPIRGIRPGTDIKFLIRSVNMKNLNIDYGDGQTRPHAETTMHAYQEPGTYVVTVKGDATAGGTGTFRVRVVVGE